MIDISRFEEKRDKEELDIINNLILEAPIDFLELDILADSSWKPKKKAPFVDINIDYSHDEKEN